jgi:hypothetical protein
MSLTTKDLLKIEKLFIGLIGKRLDIIEKKLENAEKERADLKEIVIGIRTELDTEHEFRYKKLEETAVKAAKNSKEIGLVKEYLNLST